MLYKPKFYDGKSKISAALKGVLGVLQHPGPQFWGPTIGRSG